MKKDFTSYNELPESSIPERLIKLRKTAGLSQEQLAEKLHMEAKAYGKYEQGKTLPPVDRIIDLARFYNTTSDYILLGKPISACEGIADCLIKISEHRQKILLKIAELIIAYWDEENAAF